MLACTGRSVNENSRTIFLTDLKKLLPSVLPLFVTLAVNFRFIDTAKNSKKTLDLDVFAALVFTKLQACITPSQKPYQELCANVAEQELDYTQFRSFCRTLFNV